MRKTILTAVILIALALLAWRAVLHTPDNNFSVTGTLPPIITAQKARRPVNSANGQAVSQPAASVKEPSYPAAGGAAKPRAGRQEAFAQDHISEASAKLKILEEIIRSRNDNDPRLDRDFNELSPETKTLFRREYQKLPAEDRNERGTIVYLLGKNLHSAEDWQFLNTVVSEPPCLSLNDCSKPSEPAVDSHFNSGVGITLAYPAIVALKRAEKTLKAANGKDRDEAMKIIIAAKNSRASAVSSMAADIEQRFSGSSRQLDK